MKVLFNDCYGGFGFSDEFIAEFNKRHPDKQDMLQSFDDRMCSRTDPDVIALFEEMGSKKASGPSSKLALIEIPDDVDWGVREYDGDEDIRWKLPYTKMMEEMRDIIKGTKKAEDTCRFTQLFLEGKDVCAIRSILNNELKGEASN